MNINALAIKQLPSRSILRKVVGWLRRYLPAEVTGTVAALIGINIALFWNQSTVTIALVGAWSEVVGFYLAMVVQEYTLQRTRRGQLAADGYAMGSPTPTQPVNAQSWWRSVREETALIGQSMRTLLFEFGIAEFLDALLLRPAFLTLAMRLTPDLALAVVIGKVAADAIFYSVAIASFEVRKQFSPVD